MDLTENAVSPLIDIELIVPSLASSSASKSFISSVVILRNPAEVSSIRTSSYRSPINWSADLETVMSLEQPANAKHRIKRQGKLKKCDVS